MTLIRKINLKNVKLQTGKLNMKLEKKIYMKLSTTEK